MISVESETSHQSNLTKLLSCEGGGTNIPNTFPSWIFFKCHHMRLKYIFIMYIYSIKKKSKTFMSISNHVCVLKYIFFFDWKKVQQKNVF